MENQTNSKSIILNYGVILGFIGIVAHLVLYATNSLLELQWISNLVSIAAMIAIIVIAIRKFKLLQNNFLTWGEGVKIGMGVSMVNGVIAVIYTLLFMYVIDPEFQQVAMEFQQQKWLDSGLTETQVEQFTESAKNFQGPGIITAMILAMTAFVGFVISAIAAAILKKSPEETY